MVDAEILTKISNSMERARVARQYARERRQRAAVLAERAKFLLERFDELDRAILIKVARSKTKSLPARNFGLPGARHAVSVSE